jgi:hypothetical protein
MNYWAMATISPSQVEVPHSVRLAQDALRAMGLFYWIPGGLFSVGAALGGPPLLPLGLAAAGLGLACMKVGGDSVAQSRRPAARWLMIVWASVLAVPWGMLVVYLAIEYAIPHVFLGSRASFPQAALSLIAIAALSAKESRDHFRRSGNERPQMTATDV